MFIQTYIRTKIITNKSSEFEVQAKQNTKTRKNQVATMTVPYHYCEKETTSPLEMNPTITIVGITFWSYLLSVFGG